MDYIDVYQRLFQATKQAGIVARMMQKDIINEGKETVKLHDEDARHFAMRQAKTRADEIVQEMLLSSLLPAYQDEITLDVEEDTALKSEFHNASYTYTLVLDPIDGTLDYLQQKDTYSICSALLHDHDVKVALVYFPARKEAFGYCEGMMTFHYHDRMNMEFDKGEQLNVVPLVEKPRIIYKNSRLADEVVLRLEKSGFEVLDDSLHQMGCPLAIMECLYGRGLAYFSATRNIRDILLGAILSKMERGHCYDYMGNDGKWAPYGRQKEIVFSIYEKEDIFG